MSFSDLYPTEAADHVWVSPDSVQIPSADILTYVFGNLSHYDNDSPIFIAANNPSNNVSAKQAVHTILQLAAGLKARGLKDGDCVCLHAFNTIWYPLIWLAIVGSGGRVVGSNPRYTKSELAHLLDLTTPTFIFAQSDCIDPMIEATAVAKTKIGPSRIFIMDPVTEDAEVGCPKINPTKIDTILHPKVNTPNGTESPHDENITKTTKNTLPKNESPNSTSHHTSSDITVKISDLLTVSPIVATGNTPLCSGHPSWRTLLLDHEIDWPQSGEDGIIDRHSIAVYGMTSGTTGLPKAAMISHRAIVAQTALLEDLFRARPYQPSQLICLPVFHAFASPLALLLPLRLGLPTYFLPKWSPQEYLQAIETQAITDIPVCPPIVGVLSQLPVSEQHRLRSLRCVISAGAALPAFAQNKLSDILAPGAVVTQCWGTTEAGWHTLGDLLETDRTGSVGRLIPNAQLKLVGDNGELVIEEGKSGEAFIKTSTLFSGYLGNPEANKESFSRDGFYRSGDQMYVQGGNLYYTDRVKDTMKVKGWQVSPTELETVLLQHPCIVDAAVVGVTRSNTLGIPETFPTAYVVCSGGDHASPLQGEDVKAFVAARVISYKRITGDVVFVQQIPRSPSGKILRRNLPQTERELSNETSTATTQSRLQGSATKQKSW